MSPVNAVHRSVTLSARIRYCLFLIICLGTPPVPAEGLVSPGAASTGKSPAKANAQRGAMPGAERFSDLLIVLSSDGRSYLAQHTLGTDGDLLVAPLPADRITLETRFSGPEKLTFSSAYARKSGQLALWSGSAMIRYRHHYGPGLSQPEPGIYQLDVEREHAVTGSDEPTTLPWSITWLLPDNSRLLDFSAGNEALGGRWSSSGSLISYHQTGSQSPALSLRFSLAPLSIPATLPRLTVCAQADNLSDACSPDVDGDEVPDYRDVCLPSDSRIMALVTPEKHATRLAANPATPPSPAMEYLGCDNSNAAVLAGIRFASGQSYLNVASRRLLDRVAFALQRLPDALIEIGVHTDNAGRVEHNQSLSAERARIIRQYLTLRGVPGEQLLARGYGETSPAYDNVDAAGRRANRRVELRVVFR